MDRRRLLRKSSAKRGARVLLGPDEGARRALRGRAEELVGAEWAEWYFLTPQERWRESSKLWEIYLALGGSLDPESDTQSPFFDAEEWRALFADGREGVRVLRRGGV